MRGRLARLLAAEREAGLTLVELLVAAAMSVMLVGAAASMMISSVRDQPSLSKKSQNVTTARYVLERMTREIRNGLVVYAASAGRSRSRRRCATGNAAAARPWAKTNPSTTCRVTYSCTTSECTRTETAPDVEAGGTPEALVSGLDNGDVFNWSCFAQAPCEEPGEISYIGVTLRIENPEGRGDLKIGDGAGLRTLEYARQ